MQQSPKQALLIGLLLLGLTGMLCGIALLLESMSILESGQAAQWFALLDNRGVPISAAVAAFLARRFFCGLVIGVVGAGISSFVIGQTEIMRLHSDSIVYSSPEFIVMVGIEWGSVGGVIGRIVAELDAQLVRCDAALRWRVGVLVLAAPAIWWFTHLAYDKFGWGLWYGLGCWVLWVGVRCWIRRRLLNDVTGQIPKTHIDTV